MGVGTGGATAAVIDHNDGLEPLRETAALVLAEGLTPEQAVTAVAIATAESGNRDAAEGDTTITDGAWGPSLGRFQIRCMWDQIGTGRERDCSRLNDPYFNAHSMFVVSGGGTNWSPWSVWLFDLYQPHLADARRAVADVTSTPSAFAPLTNDGRQPAAVVEVKRTPRVFAMNLWRLTIGGWLSLGQSSNPQVRDAWLKADAELFRSPDQEEYQP